LSSIAGAALLLAGSLVAIVLLLFLVRKFSDGPLGPIPGGPMSGDTAEDLTIQFDHPIGLIELQVNPESPRSITVGALPYRTELYVPAIFAERKSWPAEVSGDPHVVVRWKGKLYPRIAVRVRDSELLAELRQTIAAADTNSGSKLLMAPTTWYFRLDAPPR
jgi:hypothetical protein